jgi:hypothetical protein
MTADKAIKWSTIVAVVVVAAVAVSFSYQHALDVVGQHSRQTWMNSAFPLTVDGLIYAGSMVLLNDARRGLKAHWLAYGALGLGIAATLLVNVTSGLAYGPAGAAVAAWPAVALILSYELLMIIVRRSASQPSDAPHPAAASNGHGAPEGGKQAAEKYAAELAAGELPSVRRIQRETHVGAPRAREVHAYLSALANGNEHG